MNLTDFFHMWYWTESEAITEVRNSRGRMQMKGDERWHSPFPLWQNKMKFLSSTTDDRQVRFGCWFISDSFHKRQRSTHSHNFQFILKSNHPSLPGKHFPCLSLTLCERWVCVWYTAGDTQVSLKNRTELISNSRVQHVLPKKVR